ncbi:MAG TPA: ribonuclease R [Patescibacteria group bacterium]|nr:ribonuclease R [Patescibacteria group bacterium]
MNILEKILEFMRTEAYRPLTAEDLAAAMKIRGKALASFWPALKQLEEKAAIIKTRHDKYGVPERMNLLVGTLSVSAKGFGFLIPEDPELDDVFIPPDAMTGAMHKDKVVIRVSSRPAGSGGRASEGEVIRVVERANRTVVGSFEAGKHYGFVLPDDQRLGQDIFVPKEEFQGAESGCKVVVEITRWPEKQKSAEGKIIEILGKVGDPGIEILSIIKKHNLPTEFPEATEQAAAAVPDSINVKELAGRRDLRDLPIVTIDSEDAKDLDDAVNIERLENGRYRLGVHIADVSYYVTEDSPLDQEAVNRGTSVYLVDRVLPMLPHRLSNGICSLNAGVDRLTLSIQMDIDSQGKVLHYEIFPAVIRVHTRLSYNVVRKILADHDPELRTQYATLVPHLEEMERLCRILRERRMRRGAIDFDFPEIKVKLDEQGRPLALEKRIRSIAESVVEEFMLVANETVAEHTSRLEVPSMFRVHEEPDPEKITRLSLLLNNFGQVGRVGGKDGEVQPMALQKILSRIAGRPEERIISTVMLRSLKQARYDANNLGHFGLAASYYTHFTSPIRRYPDLIVHRILRDTFKKGGLSAKRRQKLELMLPETALHASLRERAAAEAERETVDLKKVEYMAQFIGEEFEGIINGVTAFGIFVELPNGVEGLVRVSSMDDDYYQYVEEQYSLIGERTHKIFKLGEPVRIIVTQANPETRNIDFVLTPDMLSQGRRGGRGGRPARNGNNGNPAGKNKNRAPGSRNPGRPAAGTGGNPAKGNNKEKPKPPGKKGGKSVNKPNNNAPLVVQVTDKTALRQQERDAVRPPGSPVVVADEENKKKKRRKRKKSGDKGNPSPSRNEKI